MQILLDRDGDRFAEECCHHRHLSHLVHWNRTDGKAVVDGRVICGIQRVVKVVRMPMATVLHGLNYFVRLGTAAVPRLLVRSTCCLRE